MAIEEEFGVFADETYFNSISTIEKLAEYVLRLESEEYEDNDPEPEPKPEPKKDSPKGPRLKRGDTYYLDGTCGIVLEFNDATGEGKLVSKDRITNTWEDPSFSGIWKKLQSKAPFTSSKDGRINCNMIKATKEWDEKYPCVWWCSPWCFSSSSCIAAKASWACANSAGTVSSASSSASAARRRNTHEQCHRSQERDHALRRRHRS